MQENLDGSRGVEQGVEDFAIDKYKLQASVEVQKHHTQEIRLDLSTRCREAIEGTRTFSINPLGVEKLLRGQELSRSIH